MAGIDRGRVDVCVWKVVCLSTKPDLYCVSVAHRSDATYHAVEHRVLRHSASAVSYQMKECLAVAPRVEVSK